VVPQKLEGFAVELVPAVTIFTTAGLVPVWHQETVLNREPIDSGWRRTECEFTIPDPVISMPFRE
jgi:hypothetical protein